MHFPDGARDPSMFDPFGPAGASTIALNMHESLQLKIAWETDVIPARYGGEQRRAPLDVPRQTISGVAYMRGDDPRVWRSRLAKYAAAGSRFMVAHPHEELILQGAAAGRALPVGSDALELTDWAKRGQRAVVVTPDGSEARDCVVQGVAGSSVLIDKVLTGNLARYGARIMPVVASYLDPQQGVARHPRNVEQWTVVAHAAVLEYAPELASLELGPITASAGFDGAIVYARRHGLIGNGPHTTFSLAPSISAPPGLIEADGQVVFVFEPGVTTIGELAAALELSSYVKLDGVYDATATIGVGDEIAATWLTGAADAGAVGSGAALTTYDGDGVVRPVWDRHIQLDGTAGDSVHALTQLLDLGGVPYALGLADQSHWGRQLMIRRAARYEWQWLKRILWTLRGAQRLFWIPTWRDDLPFVSRAANTITVRNDSGADFFTWYPLQRQHVQIVETDNTITRRKVTSAVDNGDGTVTLTIGTTLATSSVAMVSWLEHARLESPTVDVEWIGARFSSTIQARVVAA